MTRPRLLLDMDDVLADLVPEWLSEYNEHYKDNLKISDIKNWNISSFVKPECGNKVYALLDKYGFYRNLKPVEGAAEATKELQQYYDIGIVSAALNNPVIMKDKLDWMLFNMTHIDQDSIAFCNNKSMFDADFLLDDGLHNIKAFDNLTKGKQGILFARPWNFLENPSPEDKFDRLEGWEATLKYFLLRRSDF